MTLKQVYVIGQGSTPGLWVDDSDSGAAAALNADLVSKLATLDPSVNPCVSIAGRGTAGDQGGGTFVGVLVAGGPAIDNAMVFASSNALWRWKRVYTDHLAPAWFGATGNGATNDTTALQAALNATVTWGVPLRCDANATYLVRKQLPALYYGTALQLHTGVDVDLNGATIKLDANQWCSVFVSVGPGPIAIYNGTIDGNEGNQSRFWDGTDWLDHVGGSILPPAPTVAIIGTDKPFLLDLSILNGFRFSLLMSNVSLAYLQNVALHGAWGDGFWCWDLEDPYIDNLQISNARATEFQSTFWGSTWGQPLGGTIIRGNIGVVLVTNCQGAVKLQDGCADIVWNTLRVIAGPLTCLSPSGPHFGLKIQGSAGPLLNLRIKIDHIECDASDPAINTSTQCIGCGVYLFLGSDIEIGSITVKGGGIGDNLGYGDALDWSDVLIRNCRRTRIGQINTDASDYVAVASQDSPGATNYTDTVQIGEIAILDPLATTAAYVVLRHDSGHISIDRVRVSEAAPPAFHTQILNSNSMVNDGTAALAIGVVVSNQPVHDQLFVNPADTVNARIQIGRVSCGGALRSPVGAALLTTGGVYTRESEAEISAWDNLMPQLVSQPLVQSAVALGSPLLEPAHAPSTGLTLTHAPAGAADRVAWKNLGYSSLAAPYRVARTWTTVAPGTDPAARSGAIMIHAGGGISLMHGGGTGQNDPPDLPIFHDLWSFNHATALWTELLPTTPVPGRNWGAGCWDSDRSRFVVAGGVDVGYVPIPGVISTREYYAGDWHAVPSAISLGEAIHGDMAYDPVRHKCVMYAYDPNWGNGRLWEYDGVDWTPVRGPLPNGAIVGTRLCWDPVRAKVVLAGGLEYFDGGLSHDDIYEWDGANLTPHVWYPQYCLGAHVQIYDASRNVIFCAAIHGGQAGPGIHRHTYSRVGDVLLIQETDMPTPARSFACGAYSPAQNEVLVFGGGTYFGITPNDDTLIYKL
jgi:hypothetical protein